MNINPVSFALVVPDDSSSKPNASPPRLKPPYIPNTQLRPPPVPDPPLQLGSSKRRYASSSSRKLYRPPRKKVLLGTPHSSFRPAPQGGVKITSWNVNGIVARSGRESSELISFTRCIVAEFQTTYLVGTYVPCGSGAGDSESNTVARTRREEWAVAFYDFMTSLAARAKAENKGIIWTGDLNACVNPMLDKEPYPPGSDKKREVDVKSLGPQYALKAQLDRLELPDAWRSSHDAAEIEYSWLNTSGSSKYSSARIDHFMLSSDLLQQVEECEIRPVRPGIKKASDHRPITLTLRQRL